MKTITGTILDPTGNQVAVRISFQLTSGPTIISDDIVVGGTVYASSSPVDGTFSIELEPGTYTVVYFSSPVTARTQFVITFDATTTTPVDISTLITSGVLSAPTATQFIFLTTDGPPVDDPTNPAQPAFCYTRTRNLYAWDTEIHVWLPFLT